MRPCLAECGRLSQERGDVDVARRVIIFERAHTSHTGGQLQVPFPRAEGLFGALALGDVGADGDILPRLAECQTPPWAMVRQRPLMNARE